MTRLVHLSDLHVASDGFVPAWGQRVLATVNASPPDVLLVTGDLVDDGFEHQYERLARYLGDFEAEKKIVLPGNHDVRNNGGVLFEQIFGGFTTCWDSAASVIVGLDSTQPDLDAGRVGREQYGHIQNHFLRTDDKAKVLALHHHLLPIPGAGRDGDLTSDAGDILHLCLDYGVDIVLCGHMHRPWSWNLEGTWIVAAGTATTHRFKSGSRPSFYDIVLDDRAVLTEYDVRQETRRSQSLPLRLRGRREASRAVA